MPPADAAPPRRRSPRRGRLGESGRTGAEKDGADGSKLLRASGVRRACRAAGGGGGGGVAGSGTKRPCRWRWRRGGMRAEGLGRLPARELLGEDGLVVDSEGEVCRVV